MKIYQEKLMQNCIFYSIAQDTGPSDRVFHTETVGVAPPLAENLLIPPSWKNPPSRFSPHQR